MVPLAIKQTEKDAPAVDFGMISNVCVGILGPGLLCMPWAVNKGGIVGALGLFIVAALLNVITTKFLLSRSSVPYWEKAQTGWRTHAESPLLGDLKGNDCDTSCKYSSLEELAGEILGALPRLITAGCVIVFLIGCISGNMVALKTATEALFPSFGHMFFAMFIVIILMISSTANVEFLGKYSSPLGLLALCAVTVALCLQCKFEHRTLIQRPTIMEAFPIATFSFTVQPYILGICSNSRSPKSTCENSIYVAFIICFVLYSTVGIVGYTTFGDAVAPNVITNFESNSFFGLMTNVCMMVVIIACAPVNIFPVRNAILELAHIDGKDNGFVYRLVTAVLVFIPYTFALMGLNMATIFSFTGNSACIITCYMLPCMAVMFQTKSWREILWPGFIFFISLAMSLCAVKG